MKLSLWCLVFVGGTILYSAPSRASQPSPPPLPASMQSRVEAEAAALRKKWAERVAKGNVPARMTEPSLTAGTIITPNIDVTKAPGLPEVKLELSSGTVGFGEFFVNVVSPSGVQTLSASYAPPVFPPPPRKQSVVIQLGSLFTGGSGSLSLYSEAGPWKISSILLFANDGTLITYSGTQLAALFPSLVINVANPNPADTTVPTFGTGKILTPIVSLGSASPYFAAKIAVADNLAGVTYVSLNLTPPDGEFLVGAIATPPAPVLHGTLVPATSFPLGSTTGTYAITGIDICDAAQNCLNDTSETDIQHAFGTTTFQVVN